MGDIYFAIIPIVAVVVVLKVCLICCRIWLYQKRREQQVLLVQQRRNTVRRSAEFPTARVIAVRQVEGPGGIAQQTCYAISQPGCPTRQLTRTVIVRPRSGRPNDPNLPPSYDQAVTGADRSVKVDEGQETNPPQPDIPTAPAEAPILPPPHMPPPHMPPQRNSDLPPAYAPPTPSAPTLNYDDDEIDATDRQHLLS